MWEQKLKLLAKDFHRHYGGEVYVNDFLSSDHYSPKIHLDHFLKDWDWDLRNIKAQKALRRRGGAN